ncbi:MAG: aminotransferase class I/II-fold pyridoxal phosphate-dependent enzyme [Caldithrix sp.]|nr:aminotransferase class I/II-fold pyridoxal phosphate-dependent enzyme [Caldithrix sp.]
MDIFEKCHKFTRAKETIEAGIYPYFVPLSGNDGPRVQMDGRETIMIGSNNYLGLTHDERVIEAAVQATRNYGTSCSGSRFLNGTLDLHLQLEEQLADFMQKEAALIFSTGYMANVGAISTITNRDDYIVLDKSNHASIYAGTMAGVGCKVKRYNHNDMEHLQHIMRELEPDRGKIILTDGVFSMEGDIARIDRLTEIAKTYGARLYVDEAHGLGVIGENGRGSCEFYGFEQDVDIVMSTFSKSLASLGGFISGPQAVIDYVKHKAGPLIFSAAPTPASTAAVLKTLEIIRSEPEHIERLHQNSDYMRTELKGLGFDIGESNHTPIIPIYVRDDEKTFYCWRRLFDEGVYTNAVISPAVPPKSALIRTSYMSTHRQDDLDKVLNIMHKVGKELQLI